MARCSSCMLPCVPVFPRRVKGSGLFLLYGSIKSGRLLPRPCPPTASLSWTVVKGGKVTRSRTTRKDVPKSLVFTQGVSPRVCFLVRQTFNEVLLFGLLIQNSTSVSATKLRRADGEQLIRRIESQRARGRNSRGCHVTGPPETAEKHTESPGNEAPL